ncbi:MAG: trypsin-like peptidase domain-containing protein [Anaerolineales bacterium]
MHARANASKPPIQPLPPPRGPADDHRSSWPSRCCRRPDPPALGDIRVRRANALKEEEQESPSDPRRSSGSGFVIDPGGTIVTTASVIDGANWIQVRLFDGRRFTATVLGRDALMWPF